jgi:hypothetical protein
MTVTEAMEALQKALDREKEDRWCLCGHRWSWHKPIRSAAEAAERSGVCDGRQCGCHGFRDAEDK